MPIAPSHRRWVNLTPRAVGFLLPVLIVLIVGALAVLARAGWVSDNERASIEAGNLATLIAQDVNRNVELYDLAIEGARDAILKPEVMAASPSLRDAVLFDRAAATAFLGEITILRANGDVLASSRTAGSPLGGVANRDYFRIHAQVPSFGLYVSRPMMSRADGQQVIALSRRIDGPDGGFAGVIVGTLRLEYLHQLFSQMRVGANGSITVFRNDGSVIMREPFDPDAVGVRGMSQTLVDRASRASDGEYIATGADDGVSRLYHYRRIGKLPLIVEVGLAANEIHADWWRRTAIIGSLVALCCGCVVMLTLQLGRELRRRVEAETALVALADTDGLTGLANRRCFDRMFADEWQYATRCQQPFALLMVDADHFKAYNDLHGHAAGDEALRQIGRVLQGESRRAGGHAARYGGEEFVVILPNRNEDGALRIAEAMRRTILQLGMPHPTSKVGQLSISVGCASVVCAGQVSCDMLLKTADAALYRSKRLGRNLVTLQDAVPDALPLAS